MKILVADDDALIRRLLFALLQKLGHEVRSVEEGHAALKELESADPPDLAILDWLMPGLNGLEVCKKLRAQNMRTRTYLLLLSAKSEKHDMIAGLDAGADDYLVKPFDPMALMARLRVAQRMITYQQELQTHIADMQTLLQRHNLLGELFGKQGRVGEGSPGTSLIRGEEKTAAPTLPVPNPAALSPDRVSEMLLRALSEIGLADATVSVIGEEERPNASTFAAWAPLVLLGEGLWVDLLLEADDRSAVAKFESLLGRIPVSERELLDFLAETFNLLCTSIRNQMAEQGTAVLLPVISRSLRSEGMNIRLPVGAQITRHRLVLPEIQLYVSSIRQAAPVVQKSLGQLREFDLLAENVSSPNAKDVLLLNQGVVLNARYIEKLVSLVQGDKRNARIPVIRPSALAEFFALGRIVAM